MLPLSFIIGKDRTFFWFYPYLYITLMKNILRSEKTGTELDNLITSEIKEAYKNI